MRRLENLLLVVIVAIYAWSAWEMSAAADEHHRVRAVLEEHVAKRVDPSIAYYGPRSDWFGRPCCITLAAWR